MFCSVYKSERRELTYLYVPFKADLNELPDSLRKVFGEPEHVMDLELLADRKLALASAAEVLASIEKEGFYLQMPPSKDHPVRSF